MPRCSSTNQFAGYEDDMELEIEDEEVEGAHYAATVHATRLCAECGEEFSEYTFVAETSFECPDCGTMTLPECKECNGHGCDACHGSGEIQDATEEPIVFEIEEDGEAEGTDEGGSRYAARYLGVEVTVGIKCGRCEETFSVVATDSAKASYFDMMV